MYITKAFKMSKVDIAIDRYTLIMYFSTILQYHSPLTERSDRDN